MKSNLNWLLAFTLTLAATAQEAAPLRQIQTIPLPNVQGRIDHLALDTAGKRLFIAALGNNSLEVVDLEKGARTTSFGNLREPQGIAYIAAVEKLFVTNGGDGSCRIFDGKSVEPLQTVTLGADADNVRYDATARQIYVGDTGLAILDAASGKHLGDIKLMGHPESFQLEQQGPRIFVNVPQANHVAVVDRIKRTVTDRWSLHGSGGNFPMALDEAGHRLFIGCRSSPKLVVLDTVSGKPVTSMLIDGDCDDLFYDNALRRLYLSCGVGIIDVIDLSDATNYKMRGKIITAPGARTSLYSPQLNRFYLAVPHLGSQPAEIRVYEPQP